jgi:hypothetical protein
MSGYNPHVAAALDNVLPRTGETGDWARILRDARTPSKTRLVRLMDAARRRRLVAVAVASLLAALVAVPALAVGKDWWFDWWFLDFGGPRPVTEIAEVASGSSRAGRWVMTAYVSEDEGLCVALTMERPSSTGAQACGAPVRGAPDASEGQAPAHWLGYTYASGDKDEPAFVFGPTAAAVRRVDVILADGETQSVETIAAPDALGLPLRFYVAEVPTHTPVQTLVARETTGTEVERLELEPLQLP